MAKQNQTGLFSSAQETSRDVRGVQGQRRDSGRRSCPLCRKPLRKIENELLSAEGAFMNELPRAIPEVKVLLALTPEELAAKMLFLLKKRNDAKFHAGNLQKELWGHFSSGQPQYPRQYENEINLALAEAWAWLHAQGLVVPDMVRRALIATPTGSASRHN